MSLISGAVQDAGFANALLCSDFFVDCKSYVSLDLSKISNISAYAL